MSAVSQSDRATVGVGSACADQRGTPTPTVNSRLPFRAGGFSTLVEALDYAARGETGCNFFDSRGRLLHSVSYAEIRDRAVALARRLVRAGIGRGDRAALLADTNPDFVCFFYACQYAGAVPVPLPVPTSLGGREAYVGQLRRLLSTARVSAVMAPDEMVEGVREAAGRLGVRLIGTAEDFWSLPEAGVDLTPSRGDELSHLQYSSGSTRNPLGVAIPQRALMANGAAIAHRGLFIGPEDRCVSWLPFYHDMGLIGFLLIPMTCQRSIDFLSPDAFARRPMQWLSLISRNGGTLSFSPSFGYELCVRRVNGTHRGEFDLSAWRVAGIGGEMVHAKVLKEFSETFVDSGFRPEAFVPSYGLAEATLAFSFARLDNGFEVDHIDKYRLADEGRAVPIPANSGNGTSRVRSFVKCGKPLPGHDVQIRDEDGHVLPGRHVGTIFIKGPSLMSAYYREPDATAEVLSDDGWLNTGDMGYMSDGELVITGRSKDLVIINGRNIWPQDLEWTAEQVPEVRNRDTAAFSVTDEDGHETAVILVQCRLSDPEEREALRKAVRAAIYEHSGIDCGVVLVPPRSLPFTTSGKLSRSRAKQYYLRGSFDGTGTSEHGATPPAEQTSAASIGR